MNNIIISSSVRALALLLVGSGLLITTATPALAEPRGRILDVQSADGQVRVLFSGVELPAGASIDPASLRITLDDVPLTTSTAAAETTSVVRRAAVVVIDTSGSMQGERLAGAKAAAQEFFEAVPADVEIGLVTFASTAQVVVPLTTDRQRLSTAVRSLVANGDTALYDAAILGVRTAGTTGARTVLLLSDGLDEGSRAALAQAVSVSRNSKVLVSAVALGSGVAGPLKQIAQASGGSVVDAPRAGDLGRIFVQAATSISQQVVVTADLPKSLTKTTGTVTVVGDASGSTISDSAFTTLQPAAIKPTDFTAKPVDVGGGFFQREGVLYAALAAVFLGLLTLLGFSTVAVSGRRPAGMSRRLSVYTLAGRAPKVQEPTALGDSAVARSAVEFADRVVKDRDFESRLTRKLEAAGVPLKPSEWLLLHVGAALGTAAVLLLLSSGDAVAMALGLLLGAAVPQLYLIVKESRRTSAFLAQLPDTLQLISGSLSAGYSLPQSLDTVVREGTQPIAGEFNRALVDARLGAPVEDALDGVAARMKSEDFSWVVMAIRIQREVGGNLAEVLSTVAGTLRERERLRRQVQVLSAEGKLSAYILGGLPVIFGIYLLLVRREYVEVLYTDPIGILMLVVLVVLLTVGAVWLRKVVKVEV